MLPKVGLIYVPFKNKRHFSEVVEAWQNLTYPKDRLAIYIIPNTDPEGLMPEIERVDREAEALGLPEVRILADGKNDGFGGNHNKGIRAALEDGCEYVYLNNGDLKLDSRAIDEAVLVAEGNSRIGAVQSLMLYWKDPETVNVTGGIFHIAGHGYAGGNLTRRENLRVPDSTPIAYASAGAALYRASALREVGFFEEGFFMYHDDLELGLRLRVAKYENVLAAKSVAYHDYQFSINPGMFQWIETYRYVVTLAYWRPLTLLLLAPILLGVELATWVFALRGGWIGAKWRSVIELCKPKTWFLVVRIRMRMKRLRQVKDRELLKFFTGRIEAQEQSNWIVERIANPALSLYVRVLQYIVIW